MKLINQGQSKSLIFIFLISFFSVLFSAQTALATTIFSPLLDFEIDPGQSQAGVVKLYNETEEDLYLTASVEPFRAGDETGQPIYLPAEEKHLFLQWFKIDQEAIILRPKQVAIVPFTVTVPAQAVPGGYFAVIFWETTAGPAGDNTGLSLSSKVGSLVFLKVKGEVTEAAEIAEFKTAAAANYFFKLPINFLVRLANQGNVHLRPTGTIELKNWLGQTEILEVNSAKRYVLPDSIRRFEVVWGQGSGANVWQNFWPNLKKELTGLAFGRYTATLNLTYGLDQPKTLTEQLSFWFIPGYSIIALIILVLVLFLLKKINSQVKKIKNQARKIPDENKS